MSSHVLRAAVRKTVPWANGEGTTQTVAESRDRSWRVSIATASRASSFSAYPGFRRQIAPLTAGGMTLLVNGFVVCLPRFSIHEFDGEDTVSVEKVEAPLLDLNLFTRRGQVQGVLSIHPVKSALEIRESDDEIVLIIALGGMLTYQGTTLDDYDAVALTRSERALFGGQGVTGVARVNTADDAPAR